MRVLAYMGGLLTIAIIAAELLRPQTHAAPAASLARPEWIEIARPHPAFAISIAGFDEGELRYAIRRNVNGQGRKDTLAFGDPSAEGASALVEIYRPGPEFIGFSTPVTELAVRVPPLRLAEGFTLTEPIDTKFGPVRPISFAVQGEGGVRQCLGFAHAFEAPHLLIAGWYCNAGPEIVERSMLACGLDRLTLLGAGSEAIAELFARAELKRSFCGQDGAFIAATPKRGMDWIDAAKNPKLRGRLAAR